MTRITFIFLVSVLITTISLGQAFEFDLNTKTYIPLSGGTELLFAGNQDPDPVVLDEGMVFNGANLEYFQVVDGVLIMLNLQTFSNIKAYPATANLFGLEGTTKYYYKIEGQAPERTLVVECKNVKFRDELMETGSSPSFITYQIRVQEGNGGISFHYGPFLIEDFDLCFKQEEGCITGWLDNEDIFRELKGNPQNPQNIVITNMSAEHPTLDAYPTTGTVYLWGDDRTSTKYVVVPDLKVFPNITKGIINIHDSRIGGVNNKVKIYNNNGQLLKIESINKFGQIDISGMSPGMYQLIIVKENVQYNAKIMKM